MSNTPSFTVGLAYRLPTLHLSIDAAADISTEQMAAALPTLLDAIRNVHGLLLERVAQTVAILEAAGTDVVMGEAARGAHYRVGHFLDRPCLIYVTISHADTLTPERLAEALPAIGQAIKREHASVLHGC